jgi:phospholipase D1/2
VVTRAEAATVHIDSCNYFRAFMRAALQARRQLTIVGWDFHSRTRLLCEDETLPEDPSAPRCLGDFLNHLATRRTGLRIRILVWDFPSLFGTEREFPFFYGTRLPGTWAPHRRIELRYDDTHRLGGSHHQKLVVVDDHIAFCGGIDLTRERWDSEYHRADDPRRVHGTAPYSPYHDVAMEVRGGTARALGQLVRRRWRRAGGHFPPSTAALRGLIRRQIVARARGRVPSFDAAAGVLRGARVAISRTYAPGVDRRDAVREVEAMYLDQIHAARTSILIENQYFTSQRLGDALVARLAEPDGPQVVVIVRLLSHGWLEELTMERLRGSLIRKLQATAGPDRVRVYYPHVDGLRAGTCVDVHSKLMVVDDRWLRVGSANFANRSMGLDSECDLSLESEDAAGCAFVRDFRARLLGEHLGRAAAEVEAALLREGSLVAAIESLRRPGDTRTLREAPLPDAAAAPALLAKLGDPETPVAADVIGDLFGSDEEAVAAPPDIPATDTTPRVRRRWPLVAGIAAATLALTLAWRHTALAELANPDRAIAWARAFGERPWAPLVVLLVYVPGCLVFFPRPLITLFAVVAFGPWLGFAYTLAGLTIAALATYFAGRLLNPERVGRWIGPRLRAAIRVLRRRGLVAITAMRLVPLAPFAVEGVAAGAVRIGLVPFTIGSALGLLPGTLAATVFADQVESIFQGDGEIDYLLVGAAVVLLAGGAFVVKRWFERQPEMRS